MHSISVDQDHSDHYLLPTSWIADENHQDNRRWVKITKVEVCICETMVGGVRL